MNPNTDFTIRSFIGGYDKNFTYIITFSRLRSQVIVDASIKWEIIKPFIIGESTTLIITHSHNDHIAYLNDYIDGIPNLTIIGHPSSLEYFSDYNFKILEHKQNLKIGDATIKAIHSPGHYFDSICYQLDNVLFTGDTLFVGRTGRVKSSKSNISDLYRSIYNEILTLPHNTRIYPGHNYGHKKSITISENIKLSPLLQAKDLKDFKNRMDDYEKNRTPGF